MRRKILYPSILILLCGIGVAAGLLYTLRQRVRTAPVVETGRETCSPCAGTVVLSFEDFGPPSSSYLLLGREWNQWKGEGHQLPDDVDVKVVVYRGVELEEVKKRYPVVPGKSDYRHVEYSRAIQFLDESIGEVEGYKDDGQDAGEIKMWDELLSTLKNTRSAIIENLGAAT